jgi:pimeloyl-ACP methyl ester carboxylesterase
MLAELADVRVVGYGLADTVDAMADVVLAGAPERFFVAGHSMGGRVALAVQHLAVQDGAPERVLGLGQFGTSCEGHADAAARAAEQAARRAQIAAAERDGMRRFGESWLARMMLPAHAADPGLREAFLDMVERMGMAAMRAHINAGLTRRDMTWWLPQVACPTLVLAGEADAGRPPPVHAAMAARIPGAVLEIVPDAGHMVMMERPEPVAAAMRAWLGRGG